MEKRRLWCKANKPEAAEMTESPTCGSSDGSGGVQSMTAFESYLYFVAGISALIALYAFSSHKVWKAFIKVNITYCKIQPLI